MHPTTVQRTTNWLWLSAAAVLVLGCTFVFSHSSLHGPPCLFRAMFHVPCPGCGMTRSLMALWHGRPLLSFRYHPLGLPLFAVCWLALAAGLWTRLRPARARSADRLLSALTADRSLMLIAAALLGVWLVRLAFVLAGARFFLY